MSALSTAPNPMSDPETDSSAMSVPGERAVRDVDALQRVPRRVVRDVTAPHRAVVDLVAADRVVGQILVGHLGVDDVLRADLVLARERAVGGVRGSAQRDEHRNQSEVMLADVGAGAVAHVIAPS
jgi:hypothetical protein